MRLSFDDRTGRDQLQYESDAGLAMPGTIAIVAEADRAWDYSSWPSPAGMFLDRRFAWGPTGGVEYGSANPTDSLQALGFAAVVQEFPHVAWCTVVVTHDVDPFEFAGVQGHAPPIARRVPALAGRMMELRIHGPDHAVVSRELRRIGLDLPPGGATILVSGSRRRALNLTPQDVQFLSSPGILRGGGVSQLVERLTQIAAAPWATDCRPPDALTDLRENWLMDTEGGSEVPVLAGLRAQVEELQITLRDRTRSEQELRDAVAAAEAQRDQGREAAQRSAEENTALRQALSQDRLAQQLAQTEARLQDCEEELETTAARLDVQARRNAWLEQELARAGRPRTTAADPDPSTPTSWEDLLSSAAELPFLDLDRISVDLAPLRGHSLESVWRDRAWTSLRALSTYAETKNARGAAAIPHFTAYLQSPEARVPLPTARYVPAESELIITNRKFRFARSFPVPPAVCAEGRVFMDEHIRVGSGRPPAPRLYFYDDTSGETGNVLVGYLGKHLPAPQTN
ncbi:hypothetical protein ACIQVO_37085 [Streptomyces sp. NPDC101062]|uniref:hypothetical protein n=1 Tax=unclassified Streptomyces TaxID=2593676 RepID=UPI0038009873